MTSTPYMHFLFAPGYPLVTITEVEGRDASVEVAATCARLAKKSGGVCKVLTLHSRENGTIDMDRLRADLCELPEASRAALVQAFGPNIEGLGGER